MARKPAHLTQEDLTPQVKVDNRGRIVLNTGAQRLFTGLPYKLTVFDTCIDTKRYLMIIIDSERGRRCEVNGRSIRAVTHTEIPPFAWVPCWYDDEHKAVWAEIPKGA